MRTPMPSPGRSPRARVSGRPELGADALHLEGSNGDGTASKELSYADVSRFRRPAGWGAAPGRPTLVLELRGGEVLKIAGVSQPGIVAELSDRLGVLAADPSSWRKPRSSSR